MIYFLIWLILGEVLERRVYATCNSESFIAETRCQHWPTGSSILKTPFIFCCKSCSQKLLSIRHIQSSYHKWSTSVKTSRLVVNGVSLELRRCTTARLTITNYFILQAQMMLNQYKITEIALAITPTHPVITSGAQLSRRADNSCRRRFSWAAHTHHIQINHY